jgi:hypothetical protein
MSKDNGGIKLSPKYGVNPSVMQCFFCGDAKGVAIPGRIHKKNKEGRITATDVEAPHQAVWDMEPCDDCRELMKLGIMFVSVKDGEQGKDNPYRTGSLAVLKEDAVERMISNPDLVKVLKEKRFAFIEDHVWDKLGIPRDNFDSRTDPTSP